MTRELLIDSKTPSFFWPEAVATSVYLIDRLPTKTLNHKTPLDHLSTLTQIPSSLSLPPKIFGYTVYVHILNMKDLNLNRVQLIVCLLGMW